MLDGFFLASVERYSRVRNDAGLSTQLDAYYVRQDSLVLILNGIELAKAPNLPALSYSAAASKVT